MGRSVVFSRCLGLHSLNSGTGEPVSRQCCNELKETDFVAVYPAHFNQAADRQDQVQQARSKAVEDYIQNEDYL